MSDRFIVLFKMLINSIIVSALAIHAIGSYTPPRCYNNIVATCQLSGNGTVSGTLTLTQSRSGLRVEGSVKGLADGKHGIHVHEFGNYTNDNCDATGVHYNPLQAKHGAIDAEERHIGDWSNIESSYQTSNVDFTDKIAKLNGEYPIVDRAIVVHSGEDDLGLGGNENSTKNGNAGKRVACCVIKLNK